MQTSINEQYELFPTDNPMITIPLQTYNSLVEDSLWLESLNAAGVDNWDGISEAHEFYQQMTKENANGA